MTAAVTVEHGGPDRVEVRSDWPTPRPGRGEALVRVSAAAVNNTDIWSREGRYGTAADPQAIVGWKGVPLIFPLIQGIDIAGTVVEVGPGVDGSWMGRRVIVDPAAGYDGGFPSQIVGSELDGGFARYHRCTEHQLHDVTSSPLTDAQLACLPTAYGTALGMIERAACVAGERVLVTAGAIAGPVIALDVRRLYLHQRTVIGSTMHTPEHFRRLAVVARSGGIRPLVAATYPLAQIHAAQARFLAKDFVGKIVLEP